MIYVQVRWRRWWDKWIKITVSWFCRDVTRQHARKCAVVIMEFAFVVIGLPTAVVLFNLFRKLFMHLTPSPVQIGICITNKVVLGNTSIPNIYTYKRVVLFVSYMANFRGFCFARPSWRPFWTRDQSKHEYHDQTVIYLFFPFTRL